MRRFLFVSLWVFMLASTTSGSLVRGASQTGESVPMLMGNPERTGNLGTTGPDPERRIKVLWQHRATYCDCPKDAMWSPAYHDGTLYFSDGVQELTALDAATGEVVWVKRFEQGIAPATPAVVDGVVYFMTADFAVRAVDAADGMERWTLALPGHTACNLAERFRCYGSPLVSDGVIIVGAYSSDGYVYAIDAGKGTILWESYAGSFASVTLGGGLVFFTTGVEVVALTASTGSLVWTFADTGWNGVVALPAYADGKVYVGLGDGVFIAISAFSGEKIWAYQVGDWVSDGAVVGDTLFFADGNGKMHAIDAQTGKPTWSVSLGGGPAFAPITVAAGVVYAAGTYGTVHALDAKTGNEHWSFEIEKEISWAAVVAADGRVFVGTEDMTMVAFGN